MKHRSVREEVRLFGRNGSLVGIRTFSPDASAKVPVLLIGAGIIHRVGPSRAIVELARALARAGHPCFRFDLSGIGDSERANEARLLDAVRADIDDAITEALQTSGDARGDSGLAVVGFCSGADNAFYVAADDERIRGLILFDPKVSETAGYRRRELLKRLGSAEAWKNVVTGKSLRMRLKHRRMLQEQLDRPQDYFGFLIARGEEADERAVRMAKRGVHRLFILSSGVLWYCNAAEQLREALPNGWDEALDSVEWAMHIDHVFSTRGQVEWLCETSRAWLERLEVTEGQPAAVAAGAPTREP
jgi:dienelactone hydrolase